MNTPMLLVEHCDYQSVLSTNRVRFVKPGRPLFGVQFLGAD